MLKQDTTIDFFGITIHLPAYTERNFILVEDLAERFDDEFQSESLARLKKEIQILNIKPKPKFDSEADSTLIQSTNASTIVSVVRLILQLQKDKTEDPNFDSLLTQLKSWKMPKAQEWSVGDVFSIQLADGTFTFGQIIGRYATVAPICALFELNKKEGEVSYKELRKSKVLSVWNTSSEQLDDFTYTILQNEKLLSKPSRVLDTTKSGGATFKTLSEAYFGLIPWNVMYDESYYDSMLQKRIKRPKNIILLSAEERKNYRAKHFNI